MAVETGVGVGETSVGMIGLAGVGVLGTIGLAGVEVNGIGGVVETVADAVAVTDFLQSAGHVLADSAHGHPVAIQTTSSQIPLPHLFTHPVALLVVVVVTLASAS